MATAEPLAARTGVPITRDTRLDEMFFGDWQGLTKTRSRPARSGCATRRWREDPTVGAPAGESPFEVSARAIAAIDDLRARYDTGNVLVVSHKTVLRLVFCRLLNIELRRYRECVDWPTGAVSVLELGPCHAAARCIADERHLVPQLLPETGRDLVGEQDAGWGQLDVDFVDDRASRRRRRARLRDHDRRWGRHHDGRDGRRGRSRRRSVARARPPRSRDRPRFAARRAGASRSRR